MLGGATTRRKCRAPSQRSSSPKPRKATAPTLADVPEPEIHLRPAVGQPPGEQMAAVHKATAELAYAHIFSTAFPLDKAREKWSGHRGRVWLACREVTLVGFATASGAELDGLYVLPEESGKGVGSALLDAVGDVRRLWVLEGNRAGRDWYERRGWRNSGQRRPAYGVWDLLYVR